MDYDRRLWLAAAGRSSSDCVDEELSQLFVARSHRICAYVRGIVDGSSSEVPEGTTYTTFAKLLRKCDSVLGSESLPTDRAMDFSRFKHEGFDADSGLDSLVIWGQIRSFIKGSIDAVSEGRPLTQCEYLKLGQNRCRLSRDQRVAAYSAYERYQKYLSKESLWDDCDRVSALLGLLQSADFETKQELGVHKVYVDEIQDYTQAEIAIFFLLCGRGGLFLAGDTAQSVVEGVEFRFDEVRSVADKLFKTDRRFIPDKPVTVNTNFRSHAGILNAAAAVLERLFAVFPRSANKVSTTLWSILWHTSSRGLITFLFMELFSWIPTLACSWAPAPASSRMCAWNDCRSWFLESTALCSSRMTVMYHTGKVNLARVILSWAFVNPKVWNFPT